MYAYILKALGILLIITLISHVFRDHLDIINIGLIHIIPVVIVAIHGNTKATIFITILSVIFFNFLYIPPLYSFKVHNELYVWSFVIFGIVGWIITIQAKNLYTQTKQNEMRESLLNIISHDLRTPLSTIIGTTNLLLYNSNLDQKSTKNLLEDVNYASMRMKRLITNILDSTRLSNGDINLKFDWCDFEDIVGVALEEFSDKQKDELLDIKIEDFRLFWGDNVLLKQLIINLLDNAFKYSINNTKVTLDIIDLGNTLRIVVFNQSSHIDETKLKNIFDKFYRLEDSNDISGSGIGLSICKSIVGIHGGEIKASAVNNGILIEAILPIIKKANLI
ncbi:MAG: histidine kinase [Sulfurimonas sp. RIFOXYD2_FULL_37_8]|nr:MAG: histidine kinase [Sulfurimonas sp. RIFOXYD2_FULL_37_8]